MPEKIFSYICIQNTKYAITTAQQMNLTIEHQDLSRKAFLLIKEMILAGEVKPGEKIAQESVARKLGISRMPLHKAFQMLEYEMLVESIPRRGIFVKEPDLQEIADAFECREALESVAVRKIVESASDEQIHALAALFKPFETGEHTTDLISYQQADQEFHNQIIKLSGNRMLMRMEAIGNVLINSYRKGLIREPRETMPEHRNIIQALLKRDAAAAEKHIRNHSLLSRNAILKKINSTQNSIT